MTTPRMAVRATISSMEWVVMLGASAVFIGLTWFHVWPLGMTEVMGVVTGGVALWLVMREHWINWPIGLANCLYFAVLFFTARLYADMSLQLLSAVLILYGWWNWFYGGTAHQELIISKTRLGEWIGLALFVPLGTWAMTTYLIKVHDASPFWDGFTTALGLAATFLTCRKRLENWHFWVVADAIWIPLYFSRDLILLGFLYGVFLAMNAYGYFVWKKRWKYLQSRDATPAQLLENSDPPIANEALPAWE